MRRLVAPTVSRPSTLIFLTSAALAIVAVASSFYVQRARRDFEGPKVITMGKVLGKGALLGRSRRSHSEYFCWVSYEFTPPDGKTRRNRRLWEPACGVSAGRPIPVQHLVANPDMNRPAGSEPWFPSWLFFFGAGVAAVVAFIMRGSEQSGDGDWRVALRG